MLFPWLYTLDEVIDETYGVAVQFDEEEEEVISEKLSYVKVILQGFYWSWKTWKVLEFNCQSWKIM